MDRRFVYSGQIPQDLDVLTPQVDAMIALGYLLGATLGDATVADGLQCNPTLPASMSVVVSEGVLTSLQTVDPNSFGSLPPNTNPLMKIGINAAGTTPFTLTAPLTSGYSQNYLIEATFTEADGTAVVLPYYNASNPAAPWSGPNNSGTAQNTVRAQTVSLQLKAGVAAPAGTQVTPSVDTNWTGLYIITVNYGQSSIVAANITTYPGAPFLQAKLPVLTWTSVIWPDTGSVNALVVTLGPAPVTLVPLIGAAFKVKVANTNTASTTVNVNGYGAANIVNPDGTALIAGQLNSNAIVTLVYNGTNYQLLAGSAAIEGPSLYISGTGTFAGPAYMPTAPVGTNTTQGASTAFVQAIPHGSQAFTTSGTFPVPVGVTTVYLTGTAPGGGGGGSYAINNLYSNAGGGGSSGQSVIRHALTVTPGTPYTVTLGAPGAGASGGTGFQGNPGGALSFGSLLTLTGGGGGFGALSTNPGAGAGSSGSGSSQGGPGAGIDTTTATTMTGGYGGSSPFGQYGRGGDGGLATNAQPSVYGQNGGSAYLLVEW